MVYTKIDQKNDSGEFTFSNSNRSQFQKNQSQTNDLTRIHRSIHNKIEAANLDYLDFKGSSKNSAATIIGSCTESGDRFTVTVNKDGKKLVYNFNNQQGNSVTITENGKVLTGASKNAAAKIILEEVNKLKPADFKKTR